MKSIVILCLQTLLILQNAVKSVIIDTTDCFQDTVEYIYIEGQQTFDDAIKACEDENSVLVKIDTEEKFDFVQNFSLSIVDSDFWIGLRRESGANAFSPQSFFFLDGTSLDVDGFGGTNGEFPWITNQPNGAEEECVLVENNLTEWQDNDCESVRRVVCERPCGSALIVEQEEEDEVEIVVFVLPVIAVLIVGVIVALVVQVRLYQKETIEAEDEGSIETLSKEDETVHIRNINEKNTLQTEDEDSDILIPSPKNQKISAVDRSHTDMSETVLSF